MGPPACCPPPPHSADPRPKPRRKRPFPRFVAGTAPPGCETAEAARGGPALDLRPARPQPPDRLVRFSVPPRHFGAGEKWNLEASENEEARGRPWELALGRQEGTARTRREQRRLQGSELPGAEEACPGACGGRGGAGPPAKPCSAVIRAPRGREEGACPRESPPRAGGWASGPAGAGPALSSSCSSFWRVKGGFFGSGQ